MQMNRKAPPTPQQFIMDSHCRRVRRSILIDEWSACKWVHKQKYVIENTLTATSAYMTLFDIIL